MVCRATEGVAGRRLRAIVLQNDLLSATVLPEKGADIYRLEYKPAGVDVLWKSPWGLREPGSGFAPTADSEVAWLEHYEGGWQVLFPNGGNACTYKGVEMPFHGEASTLAWSATALNSGGDEARVRLATRLFRSPFRIERTLTVRSGEPVLILEERITNEGAEPLAAMWSHHPTLGAPFLSPDCRVDTDARAVWADATYDTRGGRIQPGGHWEWPMATTRDGRPVDLSLVPSAGGDLMAYLGDFAEGWYAVTNPVLGFGVAMVWPASVYPYAWLWQELASSTGFPWYGSAYTMAIEPASSVPGLGLVRVMEETGSHLTLQPGESRQITLRTAFYPASASQRVERVTPEGQVLLRSTSGD